MGTLTFDFEDLPSLVQCRTCGMLEPDKIVLHTQNYLHAKIARAVLKHFKIEHEYHTRTDFGDSTYELVTMISKDEYLHLTGLID